MEVAVNQKKLVLIQGDITKQETDAIVNAANSRLAGGGGVDGAIHRAGGPKIAEECRKIGGCPTGKAVITSGGNLKAKYVIHAVGPVYRGGTHGEPELLKSAYLSSLEMAEQKGLRSVSFPSISTGAYGYPIEEASQIALETVLNYLLGKKDSSLQEVYFVLYTPRDYKVYAETLRRLAEKRGLKVSGD